MIAYDLLQLQQQDIDDFFDNLDDFDLAGDDLM